MINLEEVPWIRDHKIQNEIIFPGAGYIAMAGEASRQLSGAEDYTIRNFVIKTALIMKDGPKIEIITTMRPARLTESLDLAWYDFVVFAFNGKWTKHCSGQVKAGGGEKQTVSIAQSLPRSISRPYEDIKLAGYHYGSYFQGLKEASAEPGARTARARISSPTATIQDAYQLHPTTIDCCLQLFIIACSEAVARRMDELFLPTEIAELYIGRTSPVAELVARATCSPASISSFCGNAIATSRDGDVILSMTSARFTIVENGNRDEEVDNAAAAEILWKPDIDLVPAESLIQVRREESMRQKGQSVEELSLLCMIEMNDRLKWANPVSEHLNTYKTWINLQLQGLEDDGQWMFADVFREGKALTSTERCAMISEVAKKAMIGELSPVATLVKRVFDNSDSLFQGSVQPLDILLAGDGLPKIYDALQTFSDYSAFFSTLGHAMPDIKILEIGAGTGGMTSRVLSSLVSVNGIRLYSNYWFVIPSL